MSTPASSRPRRWRPAAALLVVVALSGVLAQVTSGMSQPAGDRPRAAAPTPDPEPGGTPSATASPSAPDPSVSETELDPDWDYYEYAPEYPPSDELREMRDWCRSEGVERRADCPTVFWSDYTLDHGVAEAMAEIERWKAGDRNFLPDCHHAYHGVGQTAPDLMSYNEAMALGTASCQAGYVHGVMQIWTTRTPKSEIIDASVELCMQLESAGKRELVGFCGHGVGHAFGLYWPDDVVAVAEMCVEHMPLNDFGLPVACFDGAIMEFTGHDPATAELRELIGTYPPGSVTEEQRLELCSLIPELIEQVCWLKITQAWTDVHQDAEEMSNRCAEAPRAELESLCVRSVGEIVMRWSWPVPVTIDEERLHEALEPCDTLPEYQREWCYEGFIELMWRDEPLAGAPVDTVCDRVPARVVATCERTEERVDRVVRPAA